MPILMSAQQLAELEKQIAAEILSLRLSYRNEYERNLCLEQCTELAIRRYKEFLALWDFIDPGLTPRVISHEVFIGAQSWTIAIDWWRRDHI